MVKCHLNIRWLGGWLAEENYYFALFSSVYRTKTNSRRHPFIVLFNDFLFSLHYLIILIFVVVVVAFRNKSRPSCRKLNDDGNTDGGLNKYSFPSM